MGRRRWGKATAHVVLWVPSGHATPYIFPPYTYTVEHASDNTPPWGDFPSLRYPKQGGAHTNKMAALERPRLDVSMTDTSSLVVFSTPSPLSRKNCFDLYPRGCVILSPG